MEDHDEEIPNHHLPRMSDLENPSGHHNHPHFAQMPPDMDNHQANEFAPPPHHHRPNSGKSRQYRSPTPPPGPPPPHHHNHHGGKPMHFPSPLPPPAMGYPHQGKPHHNDHRRRKSSKAGPFAAIATLLLLAGLTALILFLVYRPNTPHFTVVATTIYLLNSTTSATETPFGSPPPTASYLATSIQFTVVTRNTHHRTSIYYDHLTTQVFYRDQAITPPSDLPPLYHRERSTVVFSPILGGGAPVPVAPGVLEGLAADEAYGMVWLRLAINGRVRFKAGNGFIKSAHYGVYVACDVLLGVKKAVVGPVPLLANHDCKVDW